MGYRAAIHNPWYRFKQTLKRYSGRIPYRNPNFFILGATRCGSTYVYRHLARHPDVFVPREKELHYFNHDGRYRGDLRNYYPRFFHYRGELVFGEATPMYFEKGLVYRADGTLEFDHESSALERIQKHFPNAKLIVSLRDPVDRLVSMYKKSYGQGKLTHGLQEEVEREMADERSFHFLARNRYDVHLDHVYEYFPRDRVKILIFEEWIRNPETGLREIEAFLQIPHERANYALASIGTNASEKYWKKDGRTSIDDMVALDAPTIDSIKNQLAPAQQYVEDLLSREVPWSLVR